MKKSHSNLVIDAIMLFILMALIGIGLLTKYVLLTGQDKWDKFGDNLELTLFNLDRHDWNQIHFLLGISLFVLLVLHILLHWKMIICIYKSLIIKKTLRIILASTLFIISIALVIFPFVFNAEIGQPTYRLHNQELTNIPIPNKLDKASDVKLSEPTKSLQQNQAIHDNKFPNIQVTGDMTLREISIEHQVPIDHLRKALNISNLTSADERLGRIRRELGFKMSMVEEIIYNYKKRNKDGKNY